MAHFSQIILAQSARLGGLSRWTFRVGYQIVFFAFG